MSHMFGQNPLPMINCFQFKQRYEKPIVTQPSLFEPKKGWSSVLKTNKLLWELKSSNNDDSSDDVRPFATQADPTKPWLKEFDQYLNIVDELLDGQTVVQWWGVSALHFQL